jgi:hypothetical protein
MSSARMKTMCGLPSVALAEEGFGGFACDPVRIARATAKRRIVRLTAAGSRKMRSAALSI